MIITSSWLSQAWDLLNDTLAIVENPHGSCTHPLVFWFNDQIWRMKQNLELWRSFRLLWFGHNSSGMMSFVTYRQTQKKMFLKKSEILICIKCGTGDSVFCLLVISLEKVWNRLLMFYTATELREQNASKMSSGCCSFFHLIRSCHYTYTFLDLFLPLETQWREIKTSWKGGVARGK